jgi:hypothetical protein
VDESRRAHRGWVEPLLNTAVVALVIGPLFAAIFWSFIDAVLDQL